MKNVTKLFLAAGLFIAAAGFVFTSCTKEGPAGAAGTDGKDAAETCKQCHAAAVVDRIATQFELSKHSWGTAAFEEAGNPGCDPCHTQLGFLYVVNNSIPSSFTFNSGTGKWVNDYSAVYSASIGEISCFTCHSKLHTTYGTADLALATTAPVSMTMLGGAQTIDLTQDSSRSNLCVKCHQPRPLTCGNDPAGRLLNYDSIKANPALVMYDSTTGAKNKYLKPSYRMHVHYGAVGAVFAGKGGIEYSGTESYTSSPHTTLASCQDCHMSEPMYGMAGGHSFYMRNGKESELTSSTTFNFSGCNVTGCHAVSPLDASSSKFKDTRAAIKLLLDALAAKINAAGGGTDILHRDKSSTNLWWGVTTNGYDGYLNIYDPSSNAAGYWRNPYPANSWTQVQKDANAALPKFPSLTFLQTGAMINFQFCLREYSLGIHNTQYVKALLKNTADMM